MLQDQDAIIRYGGQFAMGMAYRGTRNNAAIQKLLHHAVTGERLSLRGGGRDGDPGGGLSSCEDGPARSPGLSVDPPTPASISLLSTRSPDVSYDVRRAAVMNLGFVLLSAPEQCPRLVALLAASYNPHVR